MSSTSPKARRGRGRLVRSFVGISLLLTAAVVLCSEIGTDPQTIGLIYGVNSTGDGDLVGSSNACNDSAGHCTLRAAIEASNLHAGNDAISINIPTSDPGYSNGVWTIKLSKVLPDVSDSVTISGPGAGELVVTVPNPNTPTFRLFNVTTSNPVSFSGITIGPVEAPAGNDGAGISNTGTGTVNVTNCNITGNILVSGNGAGLGNRGGGTMNVTNCSITSNVASNGSGGGIFNGTGGTLTVTGTTVLNTAKTSGGGIYNAGTLTVSNSCIISCSALNGGGVFNDSANLATLKNCTLTQNFTAGLGGGGGGGAVFNHSGMLGLNNCTVSGNFTGSHTAAIGSGIFSTDGGSAVTTLKSTVVALNFRNHQSGPINDDLAGSSTGTSFASNGFNLIGSNDAVSTRFPAGNPNPNNDIVGTLASPVDPMVDPNGAQNNGGPTQTIALLVGSPAIDKGSSNGLQTDQRGNGFTRTVDIASVANATGGDSTDIGAFEFGVMIQSSSMTRNRANISVGFQAAQGATYRLERKLGLNDENWQQINGVNDLTAASTGPAAITDNTGPVSLGTAFYRVRLL